ncbi:MaoC family dehydratase N-terminal domain-containing protein [Thermodesulfobacteriota bacterium]
MEHKQIDPIEEEYEELKKNLGRVYTPEKFGELWGGSKYPKPFVPFNRDASRDAILHFVDGIGDFNPIFRDEVYASRTKYKRIIAPPCFLFSVLWAGTGIESKTGVHGWYSGSEWEWFRPIHVNDEINWKTIQPYDLKLTTGAMAGRLLIMYNQDRFMLRTKGNQEKMIAIHKGWAINAEKNEAISKGKNLNLGKHVYSDEEIKRIRNAQESEIIRGDAPRYWEDVEVGEEITPIVHGPLTINEMIVWLIGAGNMFNRSDRLWRVLHEKHPDAELGFYDPDLKTMLNVELPHIDDTLARLVGLPGAYDFGSQRVTWMSHLLTNWLGDEGFLWKMRVELRGFNVVGDTTWFRGKVTRKYSEDGRYCVDIECWGENQRGEVTTPGTATAILPSRDHGPVIYPSPRPVIDSK